MTPEEQREIEGFDYWISFIMIIIMGLIVILVAYFLVQSRTEDPKPPTPEQIYPAKEVTKK